MIYFFREKERQRFSVHCFTPQMASRAAAELSQNQEPGASSQSLTWVQSPKGMGHPQLLPRPPQEAGCEGSSQDKDAAYMGSLHVLGRNLAIRPLC